MDFGRKVFIHDSKTLSPIPTPDTSIFQNPLHSPTFGTSFPITAIAIIGIIATALLLVTYYTFCLNWHHINFLQRFPLSRHRDIEPLAALYSRAITTHGLDESVIRSIPIFQYKKFPAGCMEFGERSFCECAVCLNEFQEDEKLRIIPNCSHIFHVDCIDIWLQNNSNCPLCRTSISSTSQFYPDHILVNPSSSDQDPGRYTNVIELGNNDQALGESSTSSISPSFRKPEHRDHKKGRKLNYKVTSMVDDCVFVREKDEQFSIQTIRRSFSMDSSAAGRVCFGIQEGIEEVNSSIEGCTSSRRVRRSFFSFGHGRGSTTVLPVFLEP